jgi:nucleoside-diphosphate-sugar epimerase
MGLEVLLMDSILITGASGFIGYSLCNALSSNSIIAIDVKEKKIDNKNIQYEKVDLSNLRKIEEIYEKHKPDVVVHCAGLAHQKVGTYDKADYIKNNSVSTENLAKNLALKNKNLHFVFLSSISVYGEKNLVQPVSEDSTFNPSSDYAFSKLDAERRLINLYEKGLLNRLTILRLAPVYDRGWAFNLERRIFTPKKLAYLKFGNGDQKLSALARKNLVEFIQYLLHRPNKLGIEIMNVCDENPYRFGEIIHIYKNSNIYSSRPTITIPLSLVWFATRFIAFIYSNKKKWIHSCYNKLALDLTFDNSRMLATGFKPRHNLKTIFIDKI